MLVSPSISYRLSYCYISKSKLALPACSGVYLSSIAFIVFTLYEIKQVKFFLGHPGRSKFIVGMCFKFGLLLLQVFRPQFVVFLPLGMSYSSRNSTETLAK